MLKQKKQRRMQGKTDYNSRKIMLEGKKPRLVVRISNKYCTVQFVKSKEAQDEVILTVLSKELLDYGWPKESSGSLKSISASYLAGYLLGIKLNDKNEDKKAILDLGLKRSTKGSRVYAALKGAVDAGVEIAHNKEMLPDEKRLKGKVDIEKIKSNINAKFK